MWVASGSCGREQIGGQVEEEKEGDRSWLSEVVQDLLNRGSRLSCCSP